MKHDACEFVMLLSECCNLGFLFKFLESRIIIMYKDWVERTEVFIYTCCHVLMIIVKTEMFTSV